MASKALEEAVQFEAPIPTRSGGLSAWVESNMESNLSLDLLLERARQTNRIRDTIEGRLPDFDSAKGRQDILFNAAAMIKVAMRFQSWDGVAEGYVMLEGLLKRSDTVAGGTTPGPKSPQT